MRAGSRTPILILVAIAAAIVAVLAVAGPATGGNDDPSSIASGRAGTLALYNWLGTLGFDVHRIQGDFDLSGTDVLISSAPIQASPYTKADAQRLLAHLHGGGDVILAGNDPATLAPVLGALDVQARGATRAPTAVPAQPFDPAATVTSVPLRRADSMTATSVALASAHGDLVPLLIAGQDTVAGVARVGGAGRLYLLGSAYPLSNDGLRSGDCAALVLSLLERARGGRIRIGFDEVHHQLRVGSGDQGIGEVFRGPLLAAGLLAVLVVLLRLASGGRRLGRPQAARDPGRVPSAAEYVGSIGHLLARSKQRGGVAENYAVELKQRVGAATGADSLLDDDLFVAAISGFGEARARRTRVVLAEARRLAAARPREAQLIALAGQVDQLEIEWGAGATLPHNGAP